MTARLPDAPFLYPLTDRRMAAEHDIAAIVDQLCAGGARLIQIREKDLTTREYTRISRRAVAAAEPWQCMVIINDRADVAAYSGAHGVHLGDQELPAVHARRFLGVGAVIGVSCHSIDDVKGALDQPIDYFAVGPVYGTSSKVSRFDVVGLDLIRQARALTDLPIVAIGGVTAERASEVLQAGASGIAVISAVMQQGRVEELTRSYIRSW